MIYGAMLVRYDRVLEIIEFDINSESSRTVVVINFFVVACVVKTKFDSIRRQVFANLSVNITLNLSRKTSGSYLY